MESDWWVQALIWLIIGGPVVYLYIFQPPYKVDDDE